MKLLNTLPLVLALTGTPLSAATLKVGSPPPNIQLEGDSGGLVKEMKGSLTWSSEHLQGRVHVVFYVAPQAEDLNDEAVESIKQQGFDTQHFTSVAVINAAASWFPDAIIEAKVASSQEEYPDTVYVMDEDSVLVDKWGLADKSSSVVVTGGDGKVLYHFDGKLPATEIEVMNQRISQEIDRLKGAAKK